MAPLFGSQDLKADLMFLPDLNTIASTASFAGKRVRGGSFLDIENSPNPFASGATSAAAAAGDESELQEWSLFDADMDLAKSFGPFSSLDPNMLLSSPKPTMKQESGARSLKIEPISVSLPTIKLELDDPNPSSSTTPTNLVGASESIQRTNQSSPKTKSKKLAASSPSIGVNAKIKNITSTSIQHLKMPSMNDQGNQQQKSVKMIGAYTMEERKIKLQEFREKRKRRVYRRVRYMIRKQLSQNRPRQNGRFVKSADVAKPDEQSNDNDDGSIENLLYHGVESESTVLPTIAAMAMKHGEVATSPKPLRKRAKHTRR